MTEGEGGEVVVDVADALAGSKAVPGCCDVAIVGGRTIRDDVDDVDDALEDVEDAPARPDNTVAADVDGAGVGSDAVVVVEEEGIVIGGAQTFPPATSAVAGAPALAVLTDRRTEDTICSGGGMTGSTAVATFDPLVPLGFLPGCAVSKIAASTGSIGRDGWVAVSGEGAREEAVEGEGGREELPTSSTSWSGEVSGRARLWHSASSD